MTTGTTTGMTTILLLLLLVVVMMAGRVTCPAIPNNPSNEVAVGENEVKDHSVGAGSAGPRDKVDQELEDLGLEYGRYLQQVVSALEADKDFSAKLENASVDAIKSGAIADQLHFVDHSIRSKLDELKRIELERLHRLTMKEKVLRDRQERSNGHSGGGGGHHVDRDNPHSFEVEDLHRLILAATRDLEAIDARRKQDFKEYEMRKELEWRAQLAKAGNESERAHLMQEHELARKKHADHPAVHHPGSKAQLEEVWQEEDHLPRNEFDPKTFFSLHDLNGDGYLDVQEVEALLSLEVRKLYDPKHNPEAEDDPREMMEEFHRMREHIYREADRDRDGLISRKEFLDLTSRPDFESSDKEGWKDIGSDPDPAHRGNFNEADLSQYYERLHRQQQQQQQQQLLHHQQQQQLPAHVQAQLAQQAQYYGYEHAPPPPDYYQRGTGGGRQQQPQFVPSMQQPQQQQYHHPPPPQQAFQQHPPPPPQQQQQYHEQQINYNGQVYGMPQQYQQRQQAAVAQQPPPPPHQQQQQQQQHQQPGGASVPVAPVAQQPPQQPLPPTAAAAGGTGQQH